MHRERPKNSAEPAEPRCARCGARCELSNPGGDPARWDCVQCWVYILVPTKVTPRMPGVDARGAWRGPCPIFSVPSVPADELPGWPDELGRA